MYGVEDLGSAQRGGWWLGTPTERSLSGNHDTQTTTSQDLFEAGYRVRSQGIAAVRKKMNKSKYLNNTCTFSTRFGRMHAACLSSHMSLTHSPNEASRDAVLPYPPPCDNLTLRTPAGQTPAVLLHPGWEETRREVFIQHPSLYLPLSRLTQPSTPAPRTTRKHRGTVETGQFWDGLLGTWEAMTQGNFLDFVDDHDVGK